MNYEITDNGIEFERSAGGNFIITCKFKKEEIAQLKRVISEAQKYWKWSASKCESLSSEGKNNE